MSIIEQATKRLEQLRQSGVAMPWTSQGGPGVAPLPSPVPAPAPGPAVVPMTRSLPQAAMLRAQAAASPVEPPQPAHQVEIDLDRLAAMGYVVPGQARSSVSEQFRHIKRPLLRTARTVGPEGRGSLIMVSSALPGEGKTYCAINLAMSIAMEVDASVLLIDADVVRPSVFSRLGLAPRAGLQELLTDPTMSPDEVIVGTNVPKLSLMCAGQPSVNANELLSSVRTERLLAQLSTRARGQIIVLDSPPLLLTAEARVLATRVGQVMMIVQAERTTAANVQMAFAALEACPNVHPVLNRSRDASDLKPEGHGYYYY